MKKILLAFLTLITLSLITQPYVFATVEDDDDLPSSFGVSGFNNPSSVDAFNVVDMNGNRVFSFTPQREYVMQITITDADSIQDLKSLELRLFYVERNGSVDPTYADIEAVFDDTTDTPISGEAFVVRWGRIDENDPGSASLQDFEILYANGNDDDISSWEIVNSTTPAIAGNNTQIDTFTFEVHFRVSKVAPQSPHAEWHIGYVLEDGFVDNGSQIDTSSSAQLRISQTNPLELPGSSFNMDFYAEVQLATGETLVWSDVEAGADFFDGPNNVDDLENITFISNGTHVQNTWADQVWEIVNTGAVPLGVTMAALSEDALNDEQMFGLKVNTASISPTALRLMEFNGNSIVKTDVDTDSRTDENGITVTYSYFVSLSPQFQNATYNGKVYVSVTNSIHQARLTRFDNGNVQEFFFSIHDAIAAAQNSDTLTLFLSVQGDVTFNRPLNFNSNGYTINGNVTLNHSSNLETTFSGGGNINGNLLINTPNGSLNNTLNVLGETIITRMSSNSFNNTGDLRQGVIFNGAGKINNTGSPVDIIVNSTNQVNNSTAVVIDGNINQVRVLRGVQVTLDTNAIVERYVLEATGGSLILRGNLGAIAVSGVAITPGTNWTVNYFASSLPSGLVRNTTQNKAYFDLQKALDNAQTNDVIHVGPGTYETSVNITGSLSLIAPSGAELTELVATSAAGITLETTASNVTIQGFKVSGWSTFGIDVQGSTTLNVYDAIISSDRTAHPASVGIKLENSADSIISRTIISNVVIGIAILGSSNTVITQTEIEDTQVALSEESSSTNTRVENSLFANSALAIRRTGTGADAMVVTGNAFATVSGGVYIEDISSSKVNFVDIQTFNTFDQAILEVIESNSKLAFFGQAITGIGTNQTVLQFGLTESRTATTSESGTLTWNSSDSNVATVNSATGEVTAVTAGSVTISYSSTSGRTNRITIEIFDSATVQNPTFAEIRVSEANVTAGNVPAIVSGSSIEWTSNDLSIATIDGDGAVTALSHGPVTLSYIITEDSTGKRTHQGEIVVDVERAFGNNITLSGVVQAGEVTRTAIATESGLMWSSSDEDIATIDPTTGVITAVTGGTVTISYISSDDKTNSIEITVHPAATIIPTPTTQIIDQGTTLTLSSGILPTLNPEENSLQAEFEYSSVFLSNFNRTIEVDSEASTGTFTIVYRYVNSDGVVLRRVDLNVQINTGSVAFG